MTGLTIEIDDRAVREALQELARRGQNLKSAMEDIGNVLVSRVHQRFDLKKDPTGSPWAPWAQSTEKRHIKANRGSLLEMSGTMQGSLGHHADDHSVVVGFGVPYAVYHEFGTKHMPRRGMLSADPESGILGQDDEEAVLDILRGYLSEALK